MKILKYISFILISLCVALTLELLNNKDYVEIITTDFDRKSEYAKSYNLVSREFVAIPISKKNGHSIFFEAVENHVEKIPSLDKGYENFYKELENDSFKSERYLLAHSYYFEFSGKGICFVNANRPLPKGLLKVSIFHEVAHCLIDSRYGGSILNLIGNASQSNLNSKEEALIVESFSDAFGILGLEKEERLESYNNLLEDRKKTYCLSKRPEYNTHGFLASIDYNPLDVISIDDLIKKFSEKDILKFAKTTISNQQNNSCPR